MLHYLPKITLHIAFTTLQVPYLVPQPQAINLSGTPLNISVPTNDPNARGSRSTTNGRLQICKGKSTLSQSSFLNDGKRVWNAAPETIGKCSTLQSAKAEIKKYVKTLPL